MNRRIPPPTPEPRERAPERPSSSTCAACDARSTSGGLRHRDASDRAYCEACTKARREWAEAAFAALVVLYLGCLTGASLLGTLTTRGIGVSTLVALFSARAAWIFASRLVPRAVAPALVEPAEKVSS
jgi:hypothetical protein